MASRRCGRTSTSTWCMKKSTRKLQNGYANINAETNAHIPHKMHIPLSSHLASSSHFIFVLRQENAFSVLHIVFHHAQPQLHAALRKTLIIWHCNIFTPGMCSCRSVTRQSFLRSSSQKRSGMPSCETRCGHGHACIAVRMHVYCAVTTLGEEATLDICCTM